MNSLSKKSTEVAALEDILSIPISSCGFSYRAENCLVSNEIKTLSALISLDQEDLLKLPNFGRKSLLEIKTFLAELNLELSSDISRMQNIQVTITDELQSRFGQLIVPNEGTAEQPIGIGTESPYELGLLNRVDTLGLSDRALKKLVEINVCYVGDLVTKQKRELLQIRGMGRKVLSQIEQGLAELGLTLGMTMPEWPPVNLEQLVAEYKLSLAENSGETLAQAVKRTVHAIGSLRTKHILASRLGLESEVRTLQELADELGITRERVRQIQKKYIQTISKTESWVDVLDVKIQQLLNERKTPLYLDSLQDEDDWFAGFERDLGHLVKIIETFYTRGNANFVSFDERLVLTSIDEDEFKDIRRDILNMLEQTIDLKHTLDDVELFVENRLRQSNAEELASELFDIISKDLNFSFVDGLITLSSVGNSLTNQLRAILTEAHSPVHFSEIPLLYETKYGTPVTERYVHSCLSVGNFILFDRGVYGLEEHLNLNESTQQRIIGEIEDMILNGPENRQWHCQELLGCLGPANNTGSITKYHVNALLKKSDNLAYLGKFLWKKKSHQHEEDERMLVKNAIYETLKNAGRPLKTEELVTEISKTRGMGEYSQFIPNELYSKVDSSKWGLLERDFVLPLKEQSSFKNNLKSILENRRIAFHRTELSSLNLDLEMAPDLSSDLVYGLLLSDARFKTWRGGFVGLAQWDGPGRKTLQEVLIDLVAEIDLPATTDFIADEVGKRLGFSFHRNRISPYLNKLGLSFDRDSGFWL